MNKKGTKKITPYSQGASLRNNYKYCYSSNIYMWLVIYIPTAEPLLCASSLKLGIHVHVLACCLRITDCIFRIPTIRSTLAEHASRQYVPQYVHMDPQLQAILPLRILQTRDARIVHKQMTNYIDYMKLKLKLTQRRKTLKAAKSQGCHQGF